MKSGFIGVVGRPNVGKSTLINSIVGRKVAITSSKPGTTRNIIQGIYNDEESQMVFVDTPGIHKPKHKLGDYLNKQAYYSIKDVDVILFLVDASVDLGRGDNFILEKLKEVDTPVVLVINKVDKITHKEILEKIVEYKDLYEFSEIVPLSATKDDNIDALIKTLKNYISDPYKYYGDNDITNRPMSFLISEIVREKVFYKTGEEVPHSITCVTENVEKKKTAYNIEVSIIVDRESLKKIVIGHKGSKIKEIGTLAREELEVLLDSRVYLELKVKTVKKWRDKESHLSDLGFREFD